jgi:hypothetical protein
LHDHEESPAHFGPEELLDSQTAGKRKRDFACRFDVEAKIQKWAAAALQCDPFTQCCKIKSCRIEAQLESVGEFGAPRYSLRDGAKNRLPAKALFRRKRIQIASDWGCDSAHD